MKNLYAPRTLSVIGIAAISVFGLFRIGCAEQAADSIKTAPYDVGTEQPGSPRSLTGDLKAKLAAVGWVSRTEADGSVTLSRLVAEVQEDEEEVEGQVSDSGPAAAPEPAPEPSLAEDLQDKLTAAGWITRTEADGSVTLNMMEEETAPESPAVDEAVEETPLAQEQPSESALVSATSLAEDLKAKLTAAGWETRTEADGSVILEPIVAPVVDEPRSESPPADVTPPPAVTVVETKPEEDAQQASAESDHGQLMQELNHLGWAVERSADGSLVITPPATGAGAEGTQTTAALSTVNVCRGIAAGDGDAPVTTWAKARELARSWRDQHLGSGIVVGMIREVPPRLYIVSLVKADDSNQLMRVLAIRKRNGDIVVID